jgi:hypothetical protein
MAGTLLPSNPFKVVDRTLLVDRIDTQFGRVVAAKIFNGGSPLATTHVRIFEENKKLFLVPSAERGSPPTYTEKAKRTARYIDVPHYPISTKVEAESIQDVVGRDGQTLQTIELAKADAFASLKSNLEITREFLQCAALRGLVIDDDGTQLVDMFAEFGKTKKIIDFAFSNASTEIRTICLNISRHIEDNLLGDMTTGTEVLCSPSFFDGLIEHPNVKKAFEGYQVAADKLAGDPRKGFMFGGIKFSEYRGKAQGKLAMMPFIPEDKAIAFPVGTRNTFAEWYAPPVLNGLTKANRLGQLYYAMETTDPKGRYVELDMEMNVIAMCQRPEVLVELTMS